MTTTVLVGVLCSLFSALITFFVTHTVDKKIVQLHEQTCPARKDLQAIKAALIFMVTKSGGNPKDLDLMR